MTIYLGALNPAVLTSFPLTHTLLSVLPGSLSLVTLGCGKLFVFGPHLIIVPLSDASANGLSAVSDVGVVASLSPLSGLSVSSKTESE